MNRLALSVVFALVAASMCLGQDAAATQTPAMGASDPNVLHGTLPASLAKSIDSKKLKEGDEVDAKTISPMRTGGGVMIPSGSKIVGHVTQSKARSKGDSEASLGIAFDKIELPGGKSMAIKGTLQAVGPNPSETGPDTGAAGGGTMAAHGGDPTTMASPVSGPGVAPGTKLGGAGGGKMLTPQSTGVVGIKNLQLDNSVLTSTGKEVKLDTGAQMMIKAE